MPAPLARRPSPARRRAAFSLVELLVVVGIVAILFTIFVPYVLRIRETDRRSRCANNLRAVYASMTTYRQLNAENYPMSPMDPRRPGHYVAFTGAAAVPPAPAVATTRLAVADTRPAVGDPSTTSPPVGAGIGAGAPVPATGPAVATTRPSSGPAVAAVPPLGDGPTPDGPKYNDVTASLWLLARQGLVDPAAFVCPSGSESPDPTSTNGVNVGAARRSNFTSGEHLSYSYASPFSAYQGATGFRLHADVLPADFALMADKNPGTADGQNPVGVPWSADRTAAASANSRNHGRAGQNVLYSTGVVEFRATPYCGYASPTAPPATTYRDNVFTAYAATPAPGGPVPADFAANGVWSRDAGPAYAYDSYLVPAEGE